MLRTGTRIYTPRVLGLFVVAVCYFSVAGLSFPVLPRLVERELGGSSADIGLSFGVFAFGMLLFRPVSGVIADRWGRRPLLIAGAVAGAAAQIGHMVAAETGLFWLLLAVRALTGAVGAGMYLALATMATELPPAEHRDRVFAAFSTVVLVGFALGQTSGEWVMQQWGFWWAYILAAGYSLLSAGIALGLPETRPAEARPAGSISELFHPVAARVGVINLMVFTAFMGFNAFIADYAEEFGVEEVRWLLLLYSGTTMAVRSVSGRVMTVVPRRVLVSFAQATVIVGLVLLATAGGAAQLYAGAFVFALGLAWNVPLLILIAVDSAEPAERSTAVATVTTFGDVANSLGTLALGFVAEAVGYDGMYFTVAALVLGGLVLLRSPFTRDLHGLDVKAAGVGAPAASRT